MIDDMPTGVIKNLGGDFKRLKEPSDTEKALSKFDEILSALKRVESNIKSIMDYIESEGNHERVLMKSVVLAGKDGLYDLIEKHDGTVFYRRAN